MLLQYYDHSQARYLSELDSCPLEAWTEGYRHHRLAIHPAGFPVFLPPNKIALCDEYAAADPYDVAQGEDGEFQKRRFDLTLTLLDALISPKGSKICDLGCGEGHITEAIRRKAGKESEVVGLDYSLSAIERAHTRFPGISFAVGDAYDPPYPPSHFDIVVCNNLWEHVPDPLRLLDRIRAILKPGGFLLVSTPSRYRLQNLVRVILGRQVVLMSSHHVTEYTVGQVLEQLRYGQFVVERVSSKPIREERLLARLAHSLITHWMKITKSHHKLESTIFYVARKPEQ